MAPGTSKEMNLPLVWACPEAQDKIKMVKLIQRRLVVFVLIGLPSLLLN
jgi:hypothetical protein